MRDSTFAVQGAAFVDNEAAVGAAITYESGPTFDAVSTMSGVHIEGTPPNTSSVDFASDIDWSCDPGQWSPLTGVVEGDFEGCAKSCDAGTVGTGASHRTSTTLKRRWIASSPPFKR